MTHPCATCSQPATARVCHRCRARLGATARWRDKPAKQVVVKVGLPVGLHAEMSAEAAREGVSIGEAVRRRLYAVTAAHSEEARR